MMVQCINDKETKYLTLMKVYKVIEEGPICYIIKLLWRNRIVKGRFEKRFFIPVEEVDQ